MSVCVRYSYSSIIFIAVLIGLILGFAFSESSVFQSESANQGWFWPTVLVVFNIVLACPVWFLIEAAEAQQELEWRKRQIVEQSRENERASSIKHPTNANQLDHLDHTPSLAGGATAAQESEQEQKFNPFESKQSSPSIVVLQPVPEGPSVILPRLYLGNVDDADDIHKMHTLGIRSVLTVMNVNSDVDFYNGKSARLPSTFCQFDVFNCLDEFLHTIIPCEDQPGENLGSRFAEAFRAIELGMQQGGIIVHCLQGVSRSATVVCAYLMRSENWTLERAAQHMKTCRPQVKPNEWFVEQLAAFEKHLASGANPDDFSRWC
jgi:protein-tyrosine phosphatase